MPFYRLHQQAVDTDPRPLNEPTALPLGVNCTQADMQDLRRSRIIRRIYRPTTARADLHRCRFSAKLPHEFPTDARR